MGCGRSAGCGELRDTGACLTRYKASEKKGESHGLGIVIDPNMPAYPPRYTQLQVVQPGQQLGFDTKATYGWAATYNDDLVQMWLGTGPQLDGLGHMGEDGYFYNCNKGSEFRRSLDLLSLVHIMCRR